MGISFVSYNEEQEMKAKIKVLESLNKAGSVAFSDIVRNTKLSTATTTKHLENFVSSGYVNKVENEYAISPLGVVHLEELRKSAKIRFNLPSEKTSLIVFENHIPMATYTGTIEGKRVNSIPLDRQEIEEIKSRLYEPINEMHKILVEKGIGITKAVIAIKPKKE